MDKNISPTELEALLSAYSGVKEIKLKSLIKRCGGKDWLRGEFNAAEECYSYMIKILSEMEDEVYNSKKWADLELLLPTTTEIMDYCDSILPTYEGAVGSELTKKNSNK